MTLFSGARVYAPGEPGAQDPLPAPLSQNVDLLGRYTQAFQELSQPTRLWIGLAGLAVIAYLVHKHGGRR